MNRTATLHSATLTVGAALAVLALGLSGCSGSQDATAQAGAQASGSATAASAAPGEASGQATPTASTPSSAPPVAVALNSAHGLTAVLPTDSLTVAATNGTVTAVTVADAAGKAVAGSLAGTTWKPARNLLPQTSYVATITASDEAGATQTFTKKFSTLTTNIAGYDILFDGYKLGVGMPATVQFVTAVETKAMRAEVEKHAKVTVTPAQEGSWGWLDNRQLMWRPKTYWKPGTKISITTDFAGLQTGEKKWMKKDATGSFTVGDARILYTDIANHTLKVTENGKTLRTIPVTNGKPGFTTRSGTKVVIERFSHLKMDSTTVDIPAGSPDSYSLDVKYAMRLTWTGEFIHAAPWSVGSQGYANVSHGCTGMSTSNAAWLFDFVRAGDVDVVTGSSRIMKPTDGIGVWQYNWAQWQQESALV